MALTKRRIRHTAKTIALVPLRPARLATSFMRRLPDYLIIGAQKCGTTSLSAYLNAHPQLVHLPWAKEVHYFDRRWAHGVRYYRSWFPLRSTHASALTGEATPYYLFHPLAAERAGSTVPDARIVAVLRNPVERAYSHYKHNVRYGREPLSFSAALDAEGDRLAGEEIRLVNGAWSRPRHQHFSYVARGHYASQLRRWMSVFPREQILVLSSEALFSDPAATFDGVARFLGLDTAKLPRYRQHNASGDSSELPPDTRKRLDACFADEGAALHELLGVDFSW
jgi:hypothetical protein